MPKDCCCPKSLTYYQYNESPATEHYEYFHIRNGKPSAPNAQCMCKGKRQPRICKCQK
ncbi:unnamed protein product [Hymenolepis diminuta]|uniref:Uncharacterized protein n=1 Tax=Hymenolepis diminuta TaxID=6216 RepID=A0A564XXX6_HYMDI|nr:unnamed protein product [Hymenolepis diminuta]